MKRFAQIGLSVLVSTLAACQSYEGRLDAYSTFVVREKQLFGEKTTQIPRGAHGMKLTVGNKTDIKLSFAGGGTASFSLPKVQPQQANGSFSFVAAQIKQNFDVAGRNETVAWNGEPESRSESCVYDSYQVPVCRTECYPDGNGRTRCQDYCNYETRYVYGTRNFRGYNRYSRENLVLNFKNPNSSSVFAKFTGTTATSARFVETSSGPCLR